MTRRAHRHILLPLALAAAGLPATAVAAPDGPAAGAPGSPNSGGVGMGGSGPSSTAGPALAQPADTPVSASGNGLTVQTVASDLLTRRVSFSGTAPAADRGRTVEIERSSAGTPGSWIATAHAVVSSDGAFSVSWRANQTGRLAIEAVLLTPTASAASASSRQAGPGGAAAPAGAGGPSAAPTGPGTSPLTITVYRPSLATYYGPGFYGHRTACGQTLGRATLGVASRTLRCGTKVSILYGGRAIVVPVIDRGPYGNHATWDLTSATAQALGITETSTIGALPAR